MALHTSRPCLHRGTAQPAQMLCKHSTTACIASSVHVQAARRTFGSKVACFSHGTVAPVSSFSSSNVVLQSSGSHVLRPRVAQEPRMPSRVYSAQETPAVPQEGPEQLLLLLDYLKTFAGASSSSSSSTVAAGSAADPSAVRYEAVKGLMLADCKPQDKWLLVECGDWENRTGWTGPARTLIQVWETDAPQDDQLRITLAYNMWELTPDGVPTGETYVSGTAFEKMTTKFRGKKYLISCRIVRTPTCRNEVSLGTWLTHEYGPFKVNAKHITATNQRKRKDRKKPAEVVQDSSSGTASAA